MTNKFLELKVKHIAAAAVFLELAEETEASGGNAAHFRQRAAMHTAIAKACETGNGRKVTMAMWGWGW